MRFEAFECLSQKKDGLQKKRYFSLHLSSDSISLQRAYHIPLTLGQLVPYRVLMLTAGGTRFREHGVRHGGKNDEFGLALSISES